MRAIKIQTAILNSRSVRKISRYMNKMASLQEQVARVQVNRVEVCICPRKTLAPYRKCPGQKTIVLSGAYLDQRRNVRPFQLVSVVSDPMMDACVKRRVSCDTGGRSRRMRMEAIPAQTAPTTPIMHTMQNVIM